VYFDLLAGTAFLARSIKLCLVDNQRSSGVEQWCNGYRNRIVFDLTPDRQRRDLHKSNLLVTSRKIGPGPHHLGGMQLESYIKSTTKAPEPFLESVKGEDKKDSLALNPEFASWFVKDQQVPSFLLMSCSKEILGQIPTMIKSTKEAWTLIEGMFASQSRAGVIIMWMALTTASKGTS
jgi:hypothetical protein